MSMSRACVRLYSFPKPQQQHRQRWSKALLMPFPMAQGVFQSFSQRLVVLVSYRVIEKTLSPGTRAYQLSKVGIAFCQAVIYLGHTRDKSSTTIGRLEGGVCVRSGMTHLMYTHLSSTTAIPSTERQPVPCRRLVMRTAKLFYTAASGRLCDSTFPRVNPQPQKSRTSRLRSPKSPLSQSCTERPRSKRPTLVRRTKEMCMSLAQALPPSLPGNPLPTACQDSETSFIRRPAEIVEGLTRIDVVRPGTTLLAGAGAGESCAFRRMSGTSLLRLVRVFMQVTELSAVQ